MKVFLSNKEFPLIHPVCERERLHFTKLLFLKNPNDYLITYPNKCFLISTSYIRIIIIIHSTHQKSETVDFPRDCEFWYVSLFTTNECYYFLNHIITSILNSSFVVYIHKKNHKSIIYPWIFDTVACYSFTARIKHLFFQLFGGFVPV